MSEKRYQAQIRYALEYMYRQDGSFHQSLDALIYISNVVKTNREVMEARVFDTQAKTFIHYVGKPLDGTPA